MTWRGSTVPVALPRGNGGSGPPTSVQTPPEISANPLKSLYIYIYIVPMPISFDLFVIVELIIINYLFDV